MWIDDQVLKNCDKQTHIETWIPKEKMVVLGRSNKEESEANVEACKSDSIPILKRYGGGGTVLLYPGCVVVSVGAWVSHPYNNDQYFKGLNNAIINCINRRFEDVVFSQRGYSDIVLGDKKFAGTSLFRSRHYLLYQASVLVDLDLDLIDKYLRHPSKEPDYRKGRSHRSFLMGLNNLESSFDAKACLQLINDHLEESLNQEFESEWSQPNKDHIPYLLKRANIKP